MAKIEEAVGKTFTAYITKYALTEGIFAVKARICTQTSTDMIERVKEPGDHTIGTQYFHGEGREWHSTMEAARIKAVQMRDAKLASIDKQRARIAALTFEA